MAMIGDSLIVAETSLTQRSLIWRMMVTSHVVCGVWYAPSVFSIIAGLKSTMLTIIPKEETHVEYHEKKNFSFALCQWVKNDFFETLFKYKSCSENQCINMKL